MHVDAGMLSAVVCIQDTKRLSAYADVVYSFRSLSEL